MKIQQFKTDLAGRELVIEVGRLAQQASGSASVTYGQTTVLAACAMSREPKDANYMPLSVEYAEKLYAAGKIKSSRFLKREGRPTDEAVLTGRMVDRIIRPCFNQRIRNEIQVVLSVLSFDKENDPDIPAILAASLALGISDIPWDGPIAGLRAGRSLIKESGKDHKWVLNPTYSTREESDFDLIAAGKDGKINMLEGGAEEVSEEVLISAIEFVQPYLEKLIGLQKKIIREVGLPKTEPDVEELRQDWIKEADNWLGDKLKEAVFSPKAKKNRSDAVGILEKEMIEALIDEKAEDADKKTVQLKDILCNQIDKIVHEEALRHNRRPDGRKLDEVRPLKCQTAILKRVHGSGLFQRGETQVLSALTLGGPGDGQLIDSMEIEDTKRFMHHYNFPPFCVGETGRTGFTGRREIGHGALAEKALYPLIPKKEDFPYVIRMVSEVLSSNGSSSMASVTGSSLALMDGGVPVKRHVTGVAMGLMMETENNYKVLMDIQGPEDHHGDMDCKIAGTSKGVTACQMDVKIGGVTAGILKEVFAQARKGRLRILEAMDKIISQPRSSLSPFAPRILTIKIPTDKIGLVIGPGGKTINEIIDQTGAKIDIEDDGLVSITSLDEEGGRKALEWVNNLTREAEKGAIYQGKVVKITAFGAFVEILPGQDGLLHISEMADHRIERVEDVLQVGQVIPVKVKNIDEMGKISLTLKSVKKE